MANIFHIDRPTNTITLGTASTVINIPPQTASRLLALDADKNLTTKAVGTDIQAYDAGLTSLAGLVYASDSFIKVTATDTYAIRTIAETKTDLSLNLVENIAVSGIGGNHLTWNGTKLDVGDDWWDSFADISLTAESLIKGSGANKAQAFAKGANGTVLAVNGSGYLSWLAHANWDTAYTHSQDNSQAHSDYLLNNTSDSLTVTGDACLTIHSNTDTPTANAKMLILQTGLTTPTEKFAIDEDGEVITGIWTGTSISTAYTDAKCTATWPNTYTADQNLQQAEIGRAHV